MEFSDKHKLTFIGLNPEWGKEIISNFLLLKQSYR